jgi:hypothetical protein
VSGPAIAVAGPDPLSTTKTTRKDHDMDADAAGARAAEALRDLEEPGQPLVLLPPREFDWCWLYPFNTARAVETGSFLDALVTGPLVVPKNGAQPWVAPSSPPVERWLNEYATANGHPQVPLPARVPDPFS